MALDFAQVDARGDVTGVTVRIDRREHVAIIHSLPRCEFPLLARMSEYYQDVEYTSSELPALGVELVRCLESLSSDDSAIVQAMLELVSDSHGVDPIPRTSC
jgi:hypothetical protein